VPLHVSEELLLRLSPVIRKASERYAVDEDHADDLAQECLVHVANKLPLYREEDIGSVEAWAWKVADNLCKSLRRTDPAIGADCEDKDREIPDSAPLPDEWLERKLESAAVRAAVRRLPWRERAAIELVHLGGFSNQEAADQLGVGARAVRASACRGIQALKRMQALAVWREPFPPKAMSETGQRTLDDEQHPVLALEPPEPGGRTRIRAGLCLGGIDRLLDGVYFATGWRDLQTSACRLPGCPVIVDPAFPGARQSGIEELRILRARLPECPIIGHGDPHGAWCRTSVRNEIGFVAILAKGVDDSPEAVRLAALRAADCAGTERLLVSARDRVPRSIHRLLDAVLYGSLTRCSVGGLARTMGLSPRTLTRQCRSHGLPTPKRLLSLAVIFHVERLVRWSGHRRGPVALALGFSDTANYVHFVKRTLDATPTEIARRGGLDHVAQVMLRELYCDA